MRPFLFYDFLSFPRHYMSDTSMKFILGSGEKNARQEKKMFEKKSGGKENVGRQGQNNRTDLI